MLGCPAHEHVVLWSDAPDDVLDPGRLSEVSSILITNIPSKSKLE